MKINPQNDRWEVTWFAHREKSDAAAQWCWDMFGSGWGEYHLGPLNMYGQGQHRYVFYRLAHAQWFQLKWS
jgi:hypothetical protein